VSDLLFVVLRGSGTPDDIRRTTDALKEHTPGLEVGVGDLSADNDRAVVRVVPAPDGGDGVSDGVVWDLLRRVPEADVVLLRVGCVVGPGWHERLRAAAYEDAIIATASAIPADVLAVADASHRATGALRTSSSYGAAIGEPLWGCVYVRRDGLDVALAAQAEPANPEGVTQASLEEVLLLPGLVHVLAGAVVLAGPKRPPNGTGDLVSSGVRRALRRLEAEVEPLRVTADLRCCATPWTGTQVHALNLVMSLATTQGLRLSVLLPNYVDPSVRPHVDALPASVTRLQGDQAEVPPPHVFHRPYQLFAEEDVTRVLPPGTRFVLTHQDMILDRTPAYFPSTELWRAHMAATELSFIVADEVAFFSEHARQEAVRDGLVDPAKTSVVPPGTDHFDRSSHGEIRPAGLGAEERPFILVLGHSYFHKNRVFALRVAEELRTRHAWEGGVVFAGGRPPDGSSIADEETFLTHHPELRARFADLGRVTDEEQRWLYGHAEVVVYPTLYEGFGLIPFEAAAAGTPCIYSSRSSVAEYLPAEGALLDVADVVTTANRLSAVLERADAREAIVSAIRRAGDDLTWARAAAAYAAVYRRAMERPVGLSLAAGGDVIVTTRSQLPADETEWRLLVLSRRVGAFRLLARAVFAVVVALLRLVRRADK
jgi:glycosyltransferase involved in cell wall biosynthesis